MTDAAELFVSSSYQASMGGKGYLTLARDFSNSALNTSMCQMSASIVGPAACRGVVYYLSGTIETYVHLSGTAASQGVVEHAAWEEDHSLDTTSEENVSPLQGGNHVPINPFPLPPDEPEPERTVKDETRCRKAYSFSRFQPVRVRIYRGR